MTRKEKTILLAETKLLPLIIYSAIICFPLSLLISKEIDGVSYVALNALIIFVFGVYKTYPRIVEFSVGGNSVKLKQTLDEAEKITSELKDLRDISMSYFFSMMSDTTGSHSVAMKRYYDFLVTYNLLARRKENIINLKSELIHAISCLAITIEQKIKGHFEYDASENLMTNVKILHDKYAGASEEDIALHRAITPAFESCVAIILINSVYVDILSGAPKPVDIPAEIKKYRVDIYGRSDYLEV